MRTPLFSVDQEEDCLMVRIKAKYIREQDCKFFFGDKEFHFLCAPYSLRLQFDKEIEEDGTEGARYCVESGTLSVRVPKKVKGTAFGDLDCVSKLLARGSSKDGEDERGEGEDERGERVYYGFNNHYSEVFAGLENFDEDIIELPRPEHTSPDERKILRTLAEEAKFDPDYYLGNPLLSSTFLSFHF